MLRPYLQLVRIPAVFSSLSNAFAGWFIGVTLVTSGAVSAPGAAAAPVPALIPGLLAAGLYLLAGMALNDIADLKVDRAERPSRPLPSGAVSVARAWMLVSGFFALGLALQWLANPVAAQVGALLIAAIFLYNFVLKGTILGPVSMGLCRVLNLAGAVALSLPSLAAFAALPAAVYGALASLGFYVALVTWLARDEVQGNSVRRVKAFMIGFAAWFAGWAAFASTVRSWVSLGVVVVLIGHFWLLKNAIAGLRARPTAPASTGKTVGGMLGTMPATDALAMLATGVAIPWALAGLLWMVPGRLLARRFYST
ncbi:MAG TPA: UbiA family prenyltransferase [Fibrobacteria bacterium]|jgi:4-hydroxybenzoate polyprenyltransferase|nr:UbiA family prenyltransferase [Fibrobacteria bacterium]